MENVNKKRINLYLDVDALKRFKLLCIEEDTSVSAKINEYITNATKTKKTKN